MLYLSWLSHGQFACSYLTSHFLHFQLFLSVWVYRRPAQRWKLALTDFRIKMTKKILLQQPPLIVKQIYFNVWVMIVETLSFLNSGQTSLQFTGKHSILEWYETTATNTDKSWPVMRTEALWSTSLTLKVTQILELHRIKMESCRSDLNLLHSHLKSAQLITLVPG